ncbi:MAG: four helix bundle protein [Gammaproteobacteria bacterium]|nr:four helix bundle protein [Gammaproteobacteria bacterium]
MSNEGWVKGEYQRPHYNLEAWKESISLVKAVYQVSQSFPKEEIYGLTSQMRRAAVSVPSNLAEGAARTGQREFAQFISIARGSLSELETQLLIAVELDYLAQAHTIFPLLDRVSRLITGLHKKITSHP